MNVIIAPITTPAEDIIMYGCFPKVMKESINIKNPIINITNLIGIAKSVNNPRIKKLAAKNPFNKLFKLNIGDS